MSTQRSTDSHLMLLYRLAQDLNASLNPDEVLERTMADVITITRAERGVVLLTGQSGSTSQHLRSVAHGIEQEAFETQEFTFSRSVITQVIESGEAVLTNDATADARFSSRTSVIAQSIRSILCVPMKSKSGVLGAIYVDNRVHRGIFSQADLELLAVIAASAATAIENARLYRETENRLKTLDLLHQISQDLTASLDLNQVLTTTTLAVKDLLGGSTASILTVDGDALVFQVATGEASAGIKPFRVPLGRGIAGWVVERKEAVIVADVQNDPRFFGILDKQTGFTTQNLIAVPLVINDRAIGVIEVFNKPGGFNLSDRELLDTFASSAAFAIENARLYQVAVEKGRLERELQVARNVQAMLLPQETPRFSGWEFAARWLPAREVAGDYYDFVALEMIPGQNPRLGLVIADVADKGMPAALFMVDVRSTLRASMFAAESLVHGLTHVNQLICNDADNGMFVTLFYAEVEAGQGRVAYVNAGHNPPLLVRSDGGALEALTRTGMALGVEPNFLFGQAETTLHHGDFLLFYTDGVTDALNREGEEFGEDKLREVLMAQRGQPVAAVLAAIEDELRAHIGSVVPFDDITLMVVKKVE